MESKILSITAADIRFPTSLDKVGSDALHNPDTSCVYVTLTTDSGQQGFGLTFTIGRGNDVVCLAVEAYRSLVVGRRLSDVFRQFGQFWHELAHDSQLRWLGPEKGVIHLALAAVVNALWDLWARIENKPLWKLLVDMEPEQLISTIDFQYITDALTKEEALDILRRGQTGKHERESEVIRRGIPAYTTAVGWLGFSDEKIKKQCEEALNDNFTSFKIKVGLNRDMDERRVKMVRQLIGADCDLMVDANQCWNVDEAIDWMIPLAKYNIKWIEEPTSPDDVLGHAKISTALRPYGVGVATGEHCQNRVVFKQLLQSNALQYCQIDSCRLAGPNEILPVYLMAAKFNVPVCPHAGGVGLCEMVQHLSVFDYVCVAKTFNNRLTEYVKLSHEHFVHPVVVKDGFYQVPQTAGYNTEMKPESLLAYEYPVGSAWQALFEQGLFERPL